MIQINLLPGPKKKKRAGFSMPDFGDLASSVKDPLMLGTVGVWGLALAFVGLFFTLTTARIELLEPQFERAQQEARQYATLINEKRNMERLRDSLIVELDAIREIDADRYVWPHILEEVSKALPQFTWLVTIDAEQAPPVVGDDGMEVRPPVRFSVEGRTSDIQAYTRFVRQLEESPWLGGIVLGPTQTVTEEERPVTSFQIQGSFQTADSAFIRTAPVTEIAR